MTPEDRIFIIKMFLHVLRAQTTTLAALGTLAPDVELRKVILDESEKLAKEIVDANEEVRKQTK